MNRVVIVIGLEVKSRKDFFVNKNKDTDEEEEEDSLKNKRTKTTTTSREDLELLLAGDDE